MKKKIPKIVPLSALKDASTLYDFFMSHIEPDLVSASLPKLDEPYKGETKEEHDERYAQYTVAFAICERAMKEFLDATEEETMAVAWEMDEAAKKEDTEVGAKTLESITKKIQNQS